VEPLDPLVAAPARPVGISPAAAVHRFDKAHLVMLAEQGIVSAAAAAAGLRALLEMEATGPEGLEAARAATQAGNHAGEVFLVRRLGMEVGGYIHAGRSSWDLGGIANRLPLRGGVLEVMAALNDYRQALLDVAAAHVETVMPYYTHGQHAQPTTLAHHLHAFVCAAERDFRRLEGAYQTVDVSQAGAAAGTATRFPVSRERTAALLGFAAVSTNTRDSSYNQDYIWETAAAVSLVAASLGFLADELILWCGQEYQLIRFADRWCHTSSIMTHKRNPTAAEAVQAVRKRLGGRAPVSYTGPEVREAMGEVIRALRLLAGIVSTMHVDAAQMRRQASAYWDQAPDLAAVLVQERGLNWRMAHQVVGILVRLAEEAGIAPAEATPDLLDRAAVLFLGRPVGLSAAALARALDAAACVRTRTATGSPGPDEMRRQIARSRDLLAADRRRVAERRARLDAADRALDEAVQAVVASA
jgi:argininosuccinate lyase